MQYFRARIVTGPKLVLTLLPLALFALAATGNSAFAATSVTTCQTISAAKDYVVTADLVSVSGDCLIITASNVSLKLNGHLISSSGLAGAGVDVLPAAPARVNHVLIQGPGRVQGFANGISVNNADYSEVEFVTAAGNASNGIIGSNDTFLGVTSNVLVRNGIWGLLLLSAVNSTVQYNEMSGNGGGPAVPAAGGMRITGSADTVNNNTASGNGAQVPGAAFNAGIVISSSSTRVVGNITDGNLGAGIEVTAGNAGNQVFSNTSSAGNGITPALTDLLDDNGSCALTLWNNNSFFTSNVACIK